MLREDSHVAPRGDDAPCGRGEQMDQWTCMTGFGMYPANFTHLSCRDLPFQRSSLRIHSLLVQIPISDPKNNRRGFPKTIQVRQTRGPVSPPDLSVVVNTCIPTIKTILEHLFS